ncbi:carbonic anhydrase [Aquipuribacter sp. MA13-6]|uniref:carbonic anhydrase n=1 Tax=unclassified Aquipuribacter TaxID=2635084 RepID=UPI003EEBC3C5
MTPVRPSTPSDAWRELSLGNARFAADQAEHPNAGADQRRLVSTGQRPFAVVLGCSDSRVAAELVFDRGLGDLFVVRTAGHALDTAVLGSVEFAIEVLDVPLLVVLGHDSCGAVSAALRARHEGRVPGGFVRDIVERVTTSVLAAEHRGAATVDDIVREHVHATARQLIERSESVRAALDAGRLGVVGTYYTLADGVVEPVWWEGPDDLMGDGSAPARSD